MVVCGQPDSVLKVAPRPAAAAAHRHTDEKQKASCASVAFLRTLGVSPRSLQRRLAAAGTGCRELLKQVRADLAWRKVARTSLSFARVAELLGYDHQASFTRAFRRWRLDAQRARLAYSLARLARGSGEPSSGDARMNCV